jgi:polyhydroxybutyrate depolymerase
MTGFKINGYIQALGTIFLMLFITSCRPPLSAQATASIPATTPSPVFSASCTVGSHVEEITSGGRPRPYRLYIPPAYQPGTPAPLVFGFHGAGGTAEQYESYSKLSALADREGFIAVYPQALGAPALWNAAGGLQNEDVQLVQDLIDHLSTRCRIDPVRIYAAGFSRGGGMANRLACNLADRIAAVGSVSGAYEAAEDCSPGRPVAIVAFHGTGDADVPYDGMGNTGGIRDAYFSIAIPIPQWASGWAERNGCSTGPSTIFHEKAVSGQGWGNCRAGADVVLYTIQGGDHRWPGGAGAPSEGVDAAQIIWDFFTRHPLTKP